MKLLRLEDIKLLHKSASLEKPEDVDLSLVIGETRYSSPVYINPRYTTKKLAQELDALGYLYFMNNIGSDPESNWTTTSDFIYHANKRNYKSVNIQTDLSDSSLADLSWAQSAKMRVDVIFLCGFNVYSFNGRERALWIKDNFKNTKIIVGNLCTSDASESFAKIGIDGIAIGNPDSDTGLFSIPLFSSMRALYDKTKTRPKFFLCNDPVETDLVASALTAGADFVCSKAKNLDELKRYEYILRRQVYLTGASSSRSLSPREQEFIIINE